MSHALAPPPSAGTPSGSDFAPLLREVRAAGLLDPRPRYYAAMITTDLLAFVAVWVAVVLVGDSWWTVLLAVPAAVATTRLMFVGHDAGHQQITRSRRTASLIGVPLGNGLVGMSYGWWVAKHNRHHANPNHTEDDPDVGEGTLAWTAEQAAATRGVARVLAGHQRLLFFPLLTLLGLGLRRSSVVDLRARRDRGRVPELALLGVHVVIYLGLLLTTMSPLKAAVFVVAHQALLGLHLGCAFAPNHKGMPMPGPGEQWGHLRRQVLTSRNITGGAAVDWFLGGLNHQVEHHLFPAMPRPNLRRAKPLVQAHCARLGVAYTETGLVESYRQALEHLHRVGEPARRRA